MRSSRRVLTAAMMIVGIVSGGCTSSAPSRGDSEFDQLARQVVREWPKNPLAGVWTTAFIPLQLPTIAPPGGPHPRPSPWTSTSEQAALFASVAARGDYTLATAALPAVPAQGQVTLPSGETRVVPVESARTAFGQIAPDGSSPDPACPLPITDNGCSLTITHVALGSTMFWTNRGEARVPAWLFTVKQLNTPIARVAVSNSIWTTASPPLPGLQPTPSVYGVDTLSAVDGTHITFTLANGTCETNLKPRVYETSTAVVIGASFTPYSGPGNCGGVGLTTTVSVTLTRPLGARPLLNVGNGYPAVVGTNNSTSLT